jgi:ribosomal protein S18 acetylase RimI-like enzyme
MLADSLLTLANSNHIRKVDLTRDLDSIADLIEMCFPIHLDRDGQTYIHHMRRAARDMRIMGWLSTLSELGKNSASGFVWEEGGRIIGNLSLIPFLQAGKVFHMIANVAVHPDHRQSGIGRALTERALGYLRRRGEPFVWLQVRDDNPVAHELYSSEGFVNRFVRTTWHICPDEMKARDVDPDHLVKLKRRQQEDWEVQREWLKLRYPMQMRWNLPVNFLRFEPGFLQGLSNVFEGLFFRHWAVETTGNLSGVITWQKTESFANNLWLAFPEEVKAGALTSGLAFVLKRLPGRHPLSVDFTKGQFREVFESLGFHEFRTLIWMQCEL